MTNHEKIPQAHAVYHPADYCTVVDCVQGLG